jgi:hypothetical protein
VPNDPNTTHKLFSSRLKTPASTYVGEAGRIFYHEDTGELRLSDGVTPGGLPIYTGGGGSGISLNLYSENGLPVTVPLAIGPRSIALGDGSRSQLHGGIVQASGSFTNPGDAQTGSYIARGITNSSTFTDLALDGAAAKLYVQPESSMNFVVNIIARRSDIPGQESGAFEVRGGIDRGVDVSTTRIVGLTSTITVAEDNPGWDVRVEADAFNGALRIRVQGQNGKTIRWVAHIQTVEVHK